GLLAQGPAAWADAPMQAAQVCGQVELNPASALASARAAAEEQIRLAMTEKAGRIVQSRHTFWMPDFLAQDCVRRSLDEVDGWRCFQIVDRKDDVREHEFGPSYQTTLWIAEDPRRSAMAEQQLRTSLRRSERLLLA